jgi:hypothetical protein
MQFFGRNTGKTPSLSLMLRMGGNEEPGWKVRLFIKWIKEFGGEYVPFLAEKEKPKHHGAPDAPVFHDLSEHRRYRDAVGDHHVREAVYSNRESGWRRLKAKRDKSVSARQWKMQVKAERREAKEVA